MKNVKVAGKSGLPGCKLAPQASQKILKKLQTGCFEKNSRFVSHWAALRPRHAPYCVVLLRLRMQRARYRLPRGCAIAGTLRQPDQGQCKAGHLPVCVTSGSAFAHVHPCLRRGCELAERYISLYKQIEARCSPFEGFRSPWPTGALGLQVFAHASGGASTCTSLLNSSITVLLTANAHHQSCLSPQY